MMVALPHEGRMKGMVHVSRTTLGTRIVLLVLSAMIGACSHRTTDLSPAFTVDLQPWGYSNEPSGPPTASYSSLAFLSDDIVLVVINERRFTQAVEVSLTDEPASKVLLFNIRSNLLVTTAQIPVEKQPGAVQISEGGHFSGWNESGIQLCDLRTQVHRTSQVLLVLLWRLRRAVQSRREGWGRNLAKNCWTAYLYTNWRPIPKVILPWYRVTMPCCFGTQVTVFCKRE